jgi:hypothetical protein
MASKKKPPKTKSPPTSLKGWQQIAAFLGQPVNVAQRWAKSGMPIVLVGRSITASPADLNSWLGVKPAANRCTSRPSKAIFLQT